MAESPRIAELQEKFEDNPRRYFASLANEHRKAGDFQRAISICRIYLDNQRSHTAGHVVLGQALFQAGKIEEATESFNTVLELDPENLIALRGLGDIARTRGDLAVARNNFRKVITSDPRDHDASARLREVDQAVKSAEPAASEEWIPVLTAEVEGPVESHAEFLELPELPELPESPESPESPEFQESSQSPELQDSPKLPESLVSQDSPESPGYFGQTQARNYQLPAAAPEGSAHHSFESENLPALESPAVHEDVDDDDFVDTLLPSDSGEHRSAIAGPVESEAAEETLSVPDLMEEAGEQADLQYRTAEYSLSALQPADESDPERGPSDVDREAVELLEEAQTSLRTGEYSRMDDTGDWKPTLEEATVLPHPVEEKKEDFAPVEPAGPFITETVAELYLQQGFTGEALLVYRQLARAKPEDERIRARIESLEVRLSEEHTTRQAAIDAETAHDLPSEPAEQIEPDIEQGRSNAEQIAPYVELVIAQDAPVASIVPVDPVVPPVRARQSVREFFAVLGRAYPEPPRAPRKNIVTKEDIRAAAEITAEFGAFSSLPGTKQGTAVGEDAQPATSLTPASDPADAGSIAANVSDPQDDIRRFRAWLDGVEDS